jgi:hypothetical protein
MEAAQGGNMASPTEISDLVNSITADVRTLISDEIALVKAEIKPTFRKVGVGSGLIAGGVYFVISATIILWFVTAAGLGWLYAAHTSLSSWGAVFFGTLGAFFLLLVAAVIFILLGGKSFSGIRAPEKSPESVEMSLTALARGLEDGNNEVRAEVGAPPAVPRSRKGAWDEALGDDIDFELLGESWMS